MSGSPWHSSTGLRWRVSRFDALSLQDLERIYRARQQVFVVEQACAYLDADGCDERAWHMAAWTDGHPVPMAYARLVDPGVKYVEPSMGRVLTTEAARGRGLGRELVCRVITLAECEYPGRGLRISAQSRLEKFYAAAGFTAVGEPYLEDGILHTEMLRLPRTTA